MDAAVYELEPSAAPLCTLLNALGSLRTTNPKAEWLEDESMPRITTITASALSSATAFAVAADIFRVGDVVKFPAYGFGFLVTATATTAVSGTILGTPVSALSGSELFLIGNANAEFATLREIKFPQIVPQYNYVQNIRTPFGVSGDEDATSHYGGDERARLRKKFGIEHARTIDDTFSFGIRSISSTTRTAGGITSFVTTNVQVGTSLDEDDWQVFLQMAFRYGSSKRTAIGSPLAMSVIEGYARDNLRVVNESANRYGIKMSTYVSGQGEVTLVRNPKWRDSSVYGGYMFMLDMADQAVRERPLRPTRLRPDVQTPSADGFQDEYLTGTTIQVVHERRHAILTGITAPS